MDRRARATAPPTACAPAPTGTPRRAARSSTRAPAATRARTCLLADAKAGRHDLHLTGDPDPGCGFVIDFDGRSDPDHFGLYAGDLGGGLFRSLEANATLPDGSQGVGYHVRAYRNCWFVVFER